MKRIPTSILASLLLLVFSGYGVTNAFAVPSGTYVTIRANTLSEVVTVSSSGYLTANALSWDGSTNEEFIEVTNSNSTVSFYSVSAGKYVSASSTSTQLIANSATIGTAQEFKIQSSTYTGWANAGDDEVIYSVNLATDWTINSSTDGSIYAKTLDQAGQYQNFSVMPIPILPTSSSLNKPEPGADISEGLGAQNKGVVFENTSGVSGDYLAILKAAGVTWIRCRINVNPTTATNNYGQGGRVQIASGLPLLGYLGRPIGANHSGCMVHYKPHHAGKPVEFVHHKRSNYAELQQRLARHDSDRQRS
jgi:hypothetical protein